MKAFIWFLMLPVFGMLPGSAGPLDLNTVQARAAKGDAEAEYELGRAYHLGHGVPKDYAKAASLYRQAAAQGNAKSMYNLGYIYLHGQGVSPDGAAAAPWFQKAADLGLPAAQLQMGLYYYFGDMGLSQDYPAADKWLTLAVQHENTPQMAPAANALGAMNEHGFGMPIDRKKAVEWYTKAAESGDPRAQSNLGRIYDEGILIPKDKIQAFMWLKLAADRNDLLASHLLPEYLAGKEFSPAEIQEGKSRADNYETKHHLPHVSTLPLMATPTAPPPASVPAPAAHSNSPPSSSQISKSDGSVPSPSSPVQK